MEKMSNKNKYRIWDSLKKEYVSMSDAILLGMDGNLYVPVRGCHWQSTEPARYIIERYLGIEDRTGNPIYVGDRLQKIDSFLFDLKNIDDVLRLKDLRESGSIISEESEDCWVDAVFRGKVDHATDERFPVYWLKNESFRYEGEGLESPSDWDIVGTIHDAQKL